MAEIFTAWKLNRLIIPNRLVRSATWEGLSRNDGGATNKLVELDAALARNRIGIIINGFTFVEPRGRSQVRQIGIHKDALIKPLRKVTDAVHRAGGLVSIQLTHAGGLTRSAMIGQNPLGPSAMINPVFQEEVAELTSEQIAEIVQAFAAGASRAKYANFDAVQLHGAHGYLINQFLSPNTNRRRDEYGGSLSKRARFCFEVLSAVRLAVGPQYPVFIKLNSKDGVKGGLVLEEAVQVAAGLSEMGIDAIEVSGGGRASGVKAAMRVVRKPEDEGYFLHNAMAIKAAVKCPVIVVGGFRSRSKVEEALEHVDAVSLCRAFIRQPSLALEWENGSRAPSRCISCGQCSSLAEESGLACGQEP